MSLAQSLLIATPQPQTVNTACIDALLHFLSSFDARFSTLSSAHPDVHCLNTPEENIQIDTVRQLQQAVTQSTYQSPIQVFFLFSIEHASPAAHHALLKILEEPPGGVHIILQTHRPHTLLETLRSRCTLLPWQGMPETPAEPNETARTILAALETGTIVTALQQAEVLKERDAALLCMQACILQLHARLEQQPTEQTRSLLEGLLSTQAALEHNGNVRLCMEHVFLQFVT